METIIERYAHMCQTLWEEESLLELADAYCDPHNTLDTTDLATQLEEALDLPVGALSAYVIE